MDHMSGGAPDQDSVYSNTTFAPRLGFAFDLTGNHATVLKGSYSQYYEGIFSDIYKMAVPPTTSSTRSAGTWPGARPTGPRGLPWNYSCPLALRDEVGIRPYPAHRPHGPRRQTPAGRRVERRDSSTSSARTGVSPATGIFRENKNFMGSVLPDARWTQIERDEQREPPPCPGCDDCSPLPPTTVPAYRWANRSTSADSHLGHQPGRLPVPRPERQRVGHDGRLPQVPGPDADTEQALLRTAGRLQVSYVLLESEGTINNTSGSRSSARAHASTRRRRSASSTWTGPLDERPPARAQGVPRLRDPEGRHLGERDLPACCPGAPTRRSSASARAPSTSRGIRLLLRLQRRPLSPNLEPRGSRRLPTEHVLDLRLEKSLPGRRRQPPPRPLSPTLLNLTNGRHGHRPPDARAHHRRARCRRRPTWARPRTWPSKRRARSLRRGRSS